MQNRCKIGKWFLFSFLLVFFACYGFNFASGESSPIVVNEVELWGPPLVMKNITDCATGNVIHDNNGGPGATQWVKLINVSNKTATTQNGFSLNITNSGIGTFLHNLSLASGQYCILGFEYNISGGPGGPNHPLGIDNSKIILKYSIKNALGKNQYYEYSTPVLNDTFGDSRTWQYDNGQWVFADSLVSIPEFSFAINVLVISMISLIIFYRMKFR